MTVSKQIVAFRNKCKQKIPASSTSGSFFPAQVTNRKPKKLDRYVDIELFCYSFKHCTASIWNRYILTK